MPGKLYLCLFYFIFLILNFVYVFDICRSCVSGAASTKPARKSVASLAVVQGAMNHARKGCRVATPVLDFVGKYARHCVAFAIKIN